MLPDSSILAAASSRSNWISGMDSSGANDGDRHSCEPICHDAAPAAMVFALNANDSFREFYRSTRLLTSAPPSFYAPMIIGFLVGAHHQKSTVVLDDFRRTEEMIFEINSTDGCADQVAAPCRICSQVGLNSIVPLDAPLGSGSRKEQKSDSKWPVDLAWCPSCSLAQVTEAIATDILLRDSAPPASQAAMANAKTTVEQIVEKQQLGSESLVVEIASNNGYLLQWYQHSDVRVLGIESARNLAELAESTHGVRTINATFGLDLALQLKRDGQAADVIHATNVLSHVSDLNGVVAGFAALLKPDGVAVVEVPYLKDLLDQVRVDAIYQQHLCYFSLSSLMQLFGQHGMEIVGVERVQTSGGLRLLAARSGALPIEASVRDLMDQELTWVRNPAQYMAFGERIQSLRQELAGLLQSLQSEGKRIAVFGSPLRGNSILDSIGIGSHLKIYDPNQLVEDQPDYCLLLASGAADEVLEQQRKYREMGGRFIIPAPTVRIA
jgi:hypothetical protein